MPPADNDAQTTLPIPPVNVRFGPGDNQVMPIPWAEYMLGALAKAHPSMFGNLLKEAALGGQVR
jgi:hypothetical protein